VSALLTSIGTGFADGIAQSFLIVGNDLHAGGNFTQAGNMSANRIARWNGSARSSLGQGIENGVGAPIRNDDTIYALGVLGKICLLSGSS
jgi:hypothetical protein